MAGTEDRRAALARVCAASDVAILYAFGSRSREVRDWIFGTGARLKPGPSDVDAGVKAAAGK